MATELSPNIAIRGDLPADGTAPPICVSTDVRRICAEHIYAPGGR